MDNHFLSLLLFLGASIGLSLLMNALFLKFSTNLGTRNKEGLVRWSSQVKPSVGGISFYFCFLLSFIVVALFFPNEISQISFIGIVGACTLGFLIGLADDAFNTKPAIKFSGQLMCGMILWFSGNGISLTPVEWLNFALTLFWVAGLMNSLNMLDNMDAITTTVSIMISASLLFLTYIRGEVFLPEILILLGTMGGFLGFLYYNWNPARIYMGDTGSMFVGVFLAAFSIPLLWNAPLSSDLHDFSAHIIFVWLPFIVPIADTLTVSINRIASGKSPFVGGKDHTTHHLAYRGFKERHIAVLYGLLSILGGALACFLAFLGEESEVWHWICTAIILITVTFALYMVTYQKHGKNQT